jgi:tetratricopeptide (TPR) repeat protein
MTDTMYILRRLTAWSTSDQSLRDSGDAARDARSWATAAEFYARYLERVPEDAAIWVQLGHARKESGDLAAAQRAYLRALSIEPANPDTHVQLGHVEKLEGHLDAALARYRKALELDPNFPAALKEFEGSDSSDVGAPDSSLSTKESSSEADLERRIQLLADQFTAVKAIAFEMQRLRQRMGDLDQNVAELSAHVADLTAKSETFRSEIEKRVAYLESQSPSMQGRFSALLEQFGAIAACKNDIARHAALIDELMRRQSI